jgi:GDP-4-dehydro-6-deoxy-D-mannose reductase
LPPKALNATVLEVGPLEPTRDFVDVRDVAAALALLARRGEPFGTYSVTSGRETAIQEIVSGLLRSLPPGADVRICRTQHRAGVPRHVADISRLERLGFAPAHPLEQSLQDVVGYYRELQGRTGCAGYHDGENSSHAPPPNVVT